MCHVPVNKYFVGVSRMQDAVWRKPLNWRVIFAFRSMLSYPNVSTRVIILGYALLNGALTRRSMTTGCAKMEF